MTILDMIERARREIENAAPEQRERLGRELDMDILEHSRFQELKSLAYAEGKMSLDDAQAIYGLLGESPETFNRQPLEAKVVLTLVFKKLLDHRGG